MTASLKQITASLTDLLQPDRFRDYCPNGLQIEGRSQVSRLVSGVTASQALVDAAIDKQADAILVHHGYFWRGEDAVITGMKRRRIKSLLDNGISLLAYHLPLDAHPELGNNAQLGRRLDLQVEGWAGDDGDAALVMLGSPAQPLVHEQLRERLCERLGRTPVTISGSADTINRVAWCTGAAQGFIDHAIKAGADAYITGEISEQTTHAARENGIHFFAAGHHATERYGVQAVGEFLARQFGIQHCFVDIDNPA